jgi:5'(3')-deoxyribonucleotidase
MSRPIIIVDIDEVLARHNFALAKWHNDSFGTSHTEHTYVTDEWSRVWGTSPEETERRAASYQTHDVFVTLPVMSGAHDALAKLSVVHDLVVVTVRRRHVVDATHIWLDQHFPGIFKDVRFIHLWDEGAKTTKAEIAAELGASYLIDDSLKHCTLAAAEGIEAFLFGDYTWNKAEVLPPGVRRVKNWQEIAEHFNER